MFKEFNDVAKSSENYQKRLIFCKQNNHVVPGSLAACGCLLDVGYVQVTIGIVEVGGTVWARM